MKLISFSVWGDQPHYFHGALENVRIAKEVYPGWICRIYYSSDSSRDFVAEANSLGAETVQMAATGNWSGLFWRFLAAGEGHEAVIVRDTDSRVNVREKACVDEWLSGDKSFHCMRDHIDHNVPIMGGMWGVRNGLRNIHEQMHDWHEQSSKGSDQDFLRTVIWPEVRKDTLAHDLFWNNLYIYKDVRYTDDDVALFDDQPQPDDHPYPAGRVIFKNGEVADRRYYYEYRPKHFFGHHEVKPFPRHGPIKHGTHVGERIL